MSGTMKCGKCSKTVYDMEKQAYRGGFWHDFCFRCQSCNSKLVAGAHVDHGELPYCKSCYDKNFRPKGFHGGSTVDSFQTTPKAIDAASPTSSVGSPAASSITPSGAPSSSKFCTKCGDIRKDMNAKFCGSCGKQF